MRKKNLVRKKMKNCLGGGKSNHIEDGELSRKNAKHRKQTMLLENRTEKSTYSEELKSFVYCLFSNNFVANENVV